MKRDNIGIDIENGVDFSKTSEQDGLNGEGTKGVYMFSSTQNDSNPVLYYRGAVEDNNVLFANQCWKAVRTTETGGVKLIYNGQPSNVYTQVPIDEESYNIDTTNTDSRWTFDSTDNTWNIEINDNSQPAIEFTVPAGDNYSLVMTGTSGSSCGGTYTFYKNGPSVKSYGNGGGAAMNLSYYFGTLTTTDVIKMNYTGSSSSGCSITFKLQMVGRGDLLTSSGCNNKATDTYISADVGGTSQNMFAFNSSSNSPTYNGYMYGEIYAYSISNWTSDARFGSSFTWDGTNYTLVDDSLTTPNATHHYSCNVTTENGTCTDLRYVYYVSANAKYYVTLTGGDGIEEALAKMQINTYDSNAKNIIDTWYFNNMTGYTNKLEDTVWCNDRSIGRANGWSATGAWGTSDYKQYSLLYGAKERSNGASDTSMVKNQPSLACTNKNDRFTVNNGNGNGALDYPVALLTEDEMVLAGGKYESTNISCYLYNESTNYWSMSPDYFRGSYAYNSFVYNDGIGARNVSETGGLRPSISIKPGQLITKGTGTVTDPFVIE